MAIADLRPPTLKRGLQLEYLTVGWNILEGIIAVAAGIAADLRLNRQTSHTAD